LNRFRSARLGGNHKEPEVMGHLVNRLTGTETGTEDTHRRLTSVLHRFKGGGQGKEMRFRAFALLDLKQRLLEVIRIRDGSAHVRRQSGDIEARRASDRVSQIPRCFRDRPEGIRVKLLQLHEQDLGRLQFQARV
jgi:hypothetical protein